MHKLFFCVGEVPVCRRPESNGKSIFWKSFSGRQETYLEKFAGAIPSRYKYQRLNQGEYSTILRRAVLVLNTLSPRGLVSPRYFESMASNALVFCEESSNYQHLFPEDCYVSFRSDLRDFEEKMTWCLENRTEVQDITMRARKLVLIKHSWESRVASMIKTMDSIRV